MRQGNGRTIDAFPFQVAARFGLKLTNFLIVCGFQIITLGPPSPFEALIGLSGALCLALALWKGERPLGRSLNYWDEAAWFGLVACIV
jgi:hypothetical protein